MRNIAYYALIMVVIIIILPLIIVRGCSYSDDVETPDVQQPIEEVKTKINVYISSEDKIKEMLLEDYIKGVIAAEMPARFELEALKAQAVAARTYVYGREKGFFGSKEDEHRGADICTSHKHCQAWISKQEAFEKWGIFSAYRNWTKIERAVMETRDLIILYNDKVINPLYHASSGGRTENIEEVWESNPVDYLKSVVSNGEEESTNYIYTVKIKTEEMLDTLKSKYIDFECNEEDLFGDIKIIDYTEGGKVKTLRIGNIVIKGTEFRSLFNLRSAGFKLEMESKSIIKVTTTGYGHGVGMSQWGANYLAKKGGSFEEIIKYYYQGVNLVKIIDYKS